MASSNSAFLNQLKSYSELRSRNIYFDKTFAEKQAKAHKEVSYKESHSWWMVCVSPFVNYFETIRQRRNDRVACLYLLSLDDCFLDDIGINRADVAWAMHQKKPLESASAELGKIVHENRIAKRKRKNIESP